jgi:type VI secretion system secreted protein VgrG
MSGGHVMSNGAQLSGTERRFTFEAANCPKDTFFVVNFEGREALSELYRFELLLASKNSDLDDEHILNHPACFTLSDGLADSNTTAYRGLVREFTLLHQNSAWTFYRLILAPRLSRLESCYLSEVYLNKNRRQVFQEIINRAGLLVNDFEDRLTHVSDQITWIYACQYQETDLNYISRWCERYGIYWWYENIDGQEKAVYANAWAAHKDQALGLRYLPPGTSGTGMDGERCLQSLEKESRSVPKELVLMDYNPYRAGSPDIRGTAKVDPNGDGTVYLYGNNLISNKVAQQMATYHAESLLCRKHQYRGVTTATGVRCGHFIEVSGHFRATLNRRYLPIEVRHRGSQTGLLLAVYGIPNISESDNQDFYRAEFIAIPSDVQYRSEHKHPWPKIDGTMPAFIDAEGSGKYAELNENGEYKVRVPFDITHKAADHASAWIRLATPYAGSDHGMHFPLHKGTEVLLSFINGDPDQPVIVGAITNSLNPNQVVNANQTESRIVTAGGHELCFNDQERRKQASLTTPGGNQLIMSDEDKNNHILLKANESCWVRFGDNPDYSETQDQSQQTQLDSQPTSDTGAPGWLQDMTKIPIIGSFFNAYLIGKYSITYTVDGSFNIKANSYNKFVSGNTFNYNSGNVIGVAMGHDRISLSTTDMSAIKSNYSLMNSNYSFLASTESALSKFCVVYTTSFDRAATKVEKIANKITINGNVTYGFYNWITRGALNSNMTKNQFNEGVSKVNQIDNDIKELKTKIMNLELEVASAQVRMDDSDVIQYRHGVELIESDVSNHRSNVAVNDSESVIFI